MKGQMRIHYDDEADFLEITLGTPTPCYGEEVEPGIFLRIEEKTKEVKGVGVLSFKKRAGNLNDLKLKLPLEMAITPLQPVKACQSQ